MSRRFNEGKNYFLLFSAIFFFFEVGLNFFKIFLFFYFSVLYILRQHAEEICAYVLKIIIIR